MILIIGLGNPGSQYEYSRHNLGYRVVEALSRRLGPLKPVRKGAAICAEVEYSGKKVILAQPLTYMNRSGQAVRGLLRDYPVEFNNMLIVYDDLDLPPGSIRLKRGGGSAGHRGLQSIVDLLGTESFPRLRIGIGKPPPGCDVPDYVLQRIPDAEAELFEMVLGDAVEAVLLYLSEGIEAAMNRYNRDRALEQ